MIRRLCSICGGLDCECKQRTADVRGTATKRGYSKRWSKLAELFRRKHPLCVACLAEGRSTPAQCVDHVRPWRGDRRLFWDQSNWQSLCNACHSRKTRSEARQRA